MDLPDELRASILASNGTSPLLHHLNADSSWLVQIPYQPSQPSPTGRKFFNLVLDPWLAGPQSDVASWFSKQWHAIPPAYASIKDVEKLCRSVEQVLGYEAVGDGVLEGKKGFIDAVAISHEFTDHCHRQTLEELNPKTAIFANDKAIELIKSWNHFSSSSIYEIPAFNPSWLSLSKPPLPKHISLSRLQNGGDFLYYHSAIVISFTSSPSSDANPTTSEEVEGGQAIIYTPHGLPSSSTNPFARCAPPLKTLALLHGLHDVQIPWTGPFSRGTQQLNLGAHNALKLQRLIGARYWLSTHDEVKKGGGLVGMILRRKVVTLEEALAGELEGTRQGEEEVKVLDLENGKSLVLA